jgi:hypothetical protein
MTTFAPGLLEFAASRPRVNLMGLPDDQTILDQASDILACKQPLSNYIQYMTQIIRLLRHGRPKQELKTPLQQEFIHIINSPN